MLMIIGVSGLCTNLVLVSYLAQESHATLTAALHPAVGAVFCVLMGGVMYWCVCVCTSRQGTPPSSLPPWSDSLIVDK